MSSYSALNFAWPADLSGIPVRARTEFFAAKRPVDPSSPRLLFSVSASPRTVPLVRPTMCSARLKVGETVRGWVTALVSYGAFVRLVDFDCDGLVHISELSYQFVDRVEKFIQVGQVVDVVVLSVDERGRVQLSIKKAKMHGNERKVQLGGDGGHPWNDDGLTKWANLGPRPVRTHYPWDPDPKLFTFDWGSLEELS